MAKVSSYVCKHLNLLELPYEILQGIQNLTVKPSIAKELLPISNDDKRIKIANMVIKGNLNTKETWGLVNRINKGLFYFDKTDSSSNCIDVIYIGIP